MVREVAEETDLRVVVDGYLGWVEVIDAPEHFVILDFSVTPLDPDAPLHAGDDAAEAEWVELGDLADVRLVPGLLDFLEDCGVLDDGGRSGAAD